MRRVELFAEPVSPDAEPVSDAVRRALGSDFREIEPEGDATFAGRNVLVDVLPADSFDDDRDMPLSQYRTRVSIEEERRPEVRGQGYDYEIGRRLFEGLRKTRNYRLLLTDDMQKLLDRFDP